MKSRILAVVLLILLVAPAVHAKSYFDSYSDGLKAASSRDWNTVVSKMTEAIKGNGKEGRVRPYGTIFEEYHPYYYRGIAYVELGRYEEGLADLKKTTGPGKVQIGDVSSYINRAESKLAQGTTPPPVTDTRPPVDTRPTADPAIAQNRSRADQLVREAQRARDQARGARAETFAAAQFAQGSRFLEGASDKRITASTADEWRAVADEADKAQRAFIASFERAREQSATTTTITSSATEEVLEAAGRNEVRKALELYFGGEFDRSASAFQRLANSSHKGNHMVWAFLGASRYYSYYLKGSSDSSQLSAATDAFRRARRIKPDMQLSSKYFAPRIRNFYTKVR